MKLWFTLADQDLPGKNVSTMVETWSAKVNLENGSWLQTNDHGQLWFNMLQ